ncbi:hypothetical protein [Paraburkholderia kururiensis]|uniref:Lysozyme n=1 Tax=Paraburkholderia kururiensis TaxID=984307 RepID=A0ABZ0WN05_9BURK|nr:hypothetical protein [Paraburkholderia kururiensis]WQD78755.1 hypothetical protein U0042_03330 [Paraburkholderia kururiensis]
MHGHEEKTRAHGVVVLTAGAAIAATAAMSYYAVKPVETAQTNFAACVHAVEHEQRSADPVVREKQKAAVDAGSEHRLAALVQCTAAQ